MHRIHLWANDAFDKRPLPFYNEGSSIIDFREVIMSATEKLFLALWFMFGIPSLVSYIRTLREISLPMAVVGSVCYGWIVLCCGPIFLIGKAIHKKIFAKHLQFPAC